MMSVGPPFSIPRPAQVASASVSSQGPAPGPCCRSDTCRLPTPDLRRAIAEPGQALLVGHELAIRRRASPSAPECVAMATAGSICERPRGVASTDSTLPGPGTPWPRPGWSRCDHGSRRSSSSSAHPLRQSSPPTLTHPVEPPGVQNNHWRHDPGVDLDPVPVATRHRVDPDDLDVVVPRRDQPTELAAAQSSRRFIDRHDVQMVT